MIDKSIIINYIKNIKKEDIYNYGIKQGIKIDKHDIDIIYDYIKNRYNDIINNTNSILLEIKDKLNIKVYNKLLELYNKYKIIIDKIKR